MNCPNDREEMMPDEQKQRKYPIAPLKREFKNNK